MHEESCALFFLSILPSDCVAIEETFGHHTLFENEEFFKHLCELGRVIHVCVERTGALAKKHLQLALVGYPYQPGDPTEAPPDDLNVHEFAQLLKGNPARWEGVLR